MPGDARFHLAQLNLGRLRHPLDHPEMAEFLAALGPINALAEAAPGFVWRLTDADGRSSTFVPLPGNADPLLVVNLSVWEDLESLRHYVRRSGHSSYLRRRREWFERPTHPMAVCWWIGAGDLPDLADAQRRLEHLRVHGPSPRGWPLTEPFPPDTE